MQTENTQTIERLTKDLKESAGLMSQQQARFLVYSYYEMQENRKRAANQVKSLEGSGEPGNVLDWLFTNAYMLEKQVARALDAYSAGQPAGAWARSVIGIGPVIAAGLLAHIDIKQAPTAGHVWRFAGLDPTQEWGKGQKRPWNASLKTLCWKIGEAFVKVSGNPDAFYGQIYTQRKEQEIRRNEAGQFKEQADVKLARFKIGKATEAYKHYSAGRLPPAHIHARAKRYAVKLFLAHYQHQAYLYEYGEEPPLPYAIAQMGHAHHIKPPVS